MKKVLMVLFVVAIVAAAGVYFIMQKRGDIEPAAVLPSDVDVYVDMRNLDDEFTYAAQTKMGKVFTGIDYKKLLEISGMPKKDVAEALKQLDDAKKVLPILEQIFGECFTISYSSKSLLGVDLNNKATGIQGVLSGLTLVARPKVNTSVLSTIDSTFNNRYTVKKELYNKCEIKTVDLSSKEVPLSAYYTYTHGLLIASFSLETVKKCIDNAENPNAKTLIKSDMYKKMISKFKPGYYAFGYVDVNSIYSDIKKLADEQLKGKKQEVKDEINKQLETADSIYGNSSSVSFAEYRKGDEITSTVYSDLNMDKIDEFVKSQISSTLNISDTAKYTTADASIHSVSKFNFSEYYQFAMKLSQIDKQQIDMAKAQFKAILGVELETFLKAMGSTIGFDLGKIDGGGAYPVPNISIFVKLEDAKVVRAALDKILMSPMIPIKLKNEEYKGANLKTALLPPTIGVTPTIAYHGNMLFISSSSNYVKKMLDANGSGKSLANSAEFKRITSGEQDAISYSYVQGEKISETLKKVVDFVKGTPQAQIDKRTVYIIDNVVAPLVDALSMYKVASQIMVRDGNVIKVQSKILLQK